MSQKMYILKHCRILCNLVIWKNCFTKKITWEGTAWFESTLCIETPTLSTTQLPAKFQSYYIFFQGDFHTFTYLLK